MKEFPDDKIKVAYKTKFVLDRLQLIAGNQHFLFYHNVFKSWDCLVRG